jgi:O-antigen ligase
MGLLCLASGAALYEPRILGPLLVVALPLEVSKLAFPILETRTELGGGLGETSIIDAGRLIVAVAFLVWLIRPLRSRIDVLPTSPLTLPLALLFTVYACSTLWAYDVSAARTETMRLLFSLGGFALVPFFVRDRKALIWTMLAIVAVAGALSSIGIYQQVTGEFLWNAGLGEFGERRINTTFADPNHFARYLVAALAIGIMLWPFRNRVERTLLGVALVVSALTLLFTGSRGAWIVAAVALPWAILLLPTERTARIRALAITAASAVVVILLVSAVSPFFTKRVETVLFGVEAFGARTYLVDAGLHMFADHPLTGVGAGGFQASFEADYYAFKDPQIKANVTASHTSAITIPAELGIVGIMAVTFLIVRWGAYVRAVARIADRELRGIVIALAIATGAIFLGSQTEGRFFEDPYLWLFLGLIVAAEQIAASSGSALDTPPHYLRRPTSDQDTPQ